MIRVIWYCIYLAVIVGGVWGGFWVINKGKLGRIGEVLFSVIVLIGIAFAIGYLLERGLPPIPMELK